MPLTEDWKKAKTVFKSVTDKKKPSPKFLGVFNKGTGIEASLKKADTAKTAAELRTALVQFQKDAATYTKLLKTSAADPTSVPAQDKAAYSAAVTQLDIALGKLVTTGEGMATTLESSGGGAKAKVDPALLKIETELAAHLALRKRMAGFCTTVLSNYRKLSAEVDSCAQSATAQTAEAKKKKAAGNLSLANVAIDTVNRFREKAEGISSAADKDWADKTKNGTDMMNARSDRKDVPPAWPKDKQVAYAKESGAAFQTYDNIQKHINDELAAMRNKVKAILTTAEEARSYSGQGVDASVYVTRLTDINKELTELNRFVTDKRERIVNNTNKQKGVVLDPKTSTQDKKAGFILVRDNEIKAQPGIAQRATGLAELIKRGNLIPADDRTVPTVAPLFQTFSTQSAKATADLASYRTEQQGFINYLDGEIKKFV